MLIHLNTGVIRRHWIVTNRVGITPKRRFDAITNKTPKQRRQTAPAQMKRPSTHNLDQKIETIGVITHYLIAQ